MPSKTTKKNATKKAPTKSRGRKSAQNEVLDAAAERLRTEHEASVEVQAKPERTTDDAATTSFDEDERCTLCGEGVVDDGHVCPEEHDAAPPCPTCDGDPHDPESGTDCPTCDGAGTAPPGVEVATAADAEEGAREAEASFHGAPDEEEDDDQGDERLDDQLGRTRYLECELTKADIDEKRAQREAGDVVIEKLEAQLAGLQAEAKTIKTRIEGLQAEGRNLSKVIRSGKEFRNVHCEERRVENDKGVAGIGTVRLDTFEQIEWRELTLSERQGRLFS